LRRGGERKSEEQHRRNMTPPFPFRKRD